MLNSSSSSTSKATITWVVDDFSDRTLNTCSPSFSFPNNDKVQFDLRFRFGVKIPYSTTEFIALYLYLEKCDKPELPVRYRLSILDAKKKGWNEQDNQFTFAIDVLSRRFQTLYVERDYFMNCENGLFVNGEVTFYCEVEMIEEVSDYDQTSLIKTSQHFEAFLESGKRTDVTLKVGGQELKAHKLFLMARSPVFCAMFDNDCKEKMENIIEITDVPVDVFKELLRFLYSGKTPALDQFAPELLTAADKYQLDCLKSLCARYLASKLDVESVAETLLFADLHQATELKSKCFDFINSKRGAQVMETDGWKRFMASNCKNLLAELFQDFRIKNLN